MLSLILIVSAIIRIIIVAIPKTIWWDAAVYVGMGKYIFSQGSIGLWEHIRPPLWPLILGASWKVGLHPVVVSNVLVVLSSLLLIWLVYSMGERIRKNTGLFAALLLSGTAVFIFYSSVPLVDVPSATLAFLSLVLITRKKYALSGSTLGLAFLMRFPHVLLIAPVIVYICLGFFESKYENKYKTILKRVAAYITGFILITLPYFIVNYFLYSNPFTPIIDGNTVAVENPLAPRHGYFFYIKALLAQNIFLLFAAIPFFLLLKKIRAHAEDKSFLEHPLTLFTLCTVVIAGYFISLTHTELRYSLAFVPFLSVLAGYGITYVLEKYKKISVTAALSVISLVFIITISIIANSQAAKNIVFNDQKRVVGYEKVFNFFEDKPRARILTSNPQIAAYTDVYVVGFYDIWQRAQNLFIEHKNNVDYIVLDTCTMTCAPGDESCLKAKTELLAILNERYTRVLNEQTGLCEFMVYSLR